MTGPDKVARSAGGRGHNIVPMCAAINLSRLVKRGGGVVVWLPTIGNIPNGGYMTYYLPRDIRN